MARQLFGTDGIRGVAGEFPLDPRTVFAFGEALGEDVTANGRGSEALIGADTRESGGWIAALVAGGLERRGVRTRHAGVITTPGVARLTAAGPFAAGVMISASHNPYQDNGIKVFSHSGFKLPDEEEHAIERALLRLREEGPEPQPAALAVDEELDRQYLEYLRSSAAVRFDGVRLALDCGNGAAWRLAPELFRGLGAEVVTVGASPDGRNINLQCGALHPEDLARAVVEHGADFGVAFDGDADRAIFVARSGRIVNGDGVLLALARAWKAAGRLTGDTVVSTVMANLGLERALERERIRMIRTPVGDKYVLEEMVRRGAVLGGEQSGHVIFREYATTGDGILTALKLFEIARLAGAGLDELTSGLEVYPQKLVNIRVREKQGLLEHPAVAREIRRAEDALAGSGRVLVRFSGTEPLARVMVEAADAGLVDAFSASIAGVIRETLGA
ncbi:MAG TPA: phosphoglucosamine mutase [Bryobacteraceae bacterium]|nr:phosphoglucosamine mutase [Bryobacteraceae bacterium]